MTDDLRLNHFFNINNYRLSAEYQGFAKSVGLPVPPGEQPSLLGERWEFTEELYDEFLNMLPPLRYFGRSFYMSEFAFNDITTKFSREGDRYYAEHARLPSRKMVPGLSVR